MLTLYTFFVWKTRYGKNTTKMPQLSCQLTRYRIFLVEYLLLETAI